MSRRHFTIECESGMALIKDLQSTNGTFLNGKRVQAESLSDRDRVIAGLTTFIVRLIA
jgi:pSer/pThr/pTyr-binding forkhead associated (FHA) protein